MFKVFLVDDEELVIKSLIASVNWNEYGYEVVGYALSGTEAFEAITRIKPDVVFTDIRMPGMSGLELIKKVKEAGSRALVILISGYAEFAFAQKAINYGAFGYCLKPFDDDEIAGYLNKATAILEDRQSSSETKILDFIEENNVQAQDGLRKALKLFGIDMESEAGIKVVVSIGKNKLRLYGVSNCIILRIGYGKYAYLIQADRDNRISIDLGAASTNGIKGIGASGIHRHAEQIKEAIHSAELKAYRYFTMGKEYSLAEEADAEALENVQSIRRLEEAVEKNHLDALRELLDEMIGLFKGGQLNIKHALIVYNHILSFIQKHEDEPYEDYMYSEEKLTRLFNSAEDMLLHLKGLLAEKLENNNDRMLPKARNRTFNSIFKYVNENYCSDI